MRLGRLKPDDYIKILNAVGWTLVVAYLLSMFAVPFFQSGSDWRALQDVWHSWQGLNVGMLAFTASIIAFNIAGYKAAEERRRNFAAAQAFLPQEFSELTGYCQESMAILAEVWINVCAAEEDKEPVRKPMPKLPESYKEVFRDCIKFAKPNVGNFLAEILMKLQIHHSRLQSLLKNLQPDSDAVGLDRNVVSSLFGVSEIQALINTNFNYARGRNDFDESSPKLENYYTALNIGGIEVDDYEGLGELIERAVIGD